ncbi:hypothetical protein ELE36_18955 [Pseudolysobacter antarcticus]|uniref:Uncharacterized protein n=1 Tax=Pseudolysobacter antarcticus TaxID=2511995 RepID=A0A411HP50_9GAMM|nr:hypothetical protein [Pseudolysobacter antarcticus]QBB72279.1 hypothetical protein ELE36_18955 [Pseudolysobacter antarcticus]
MLNTILRHVRTSASALVVLAAMSWAGHASAAIGTNDNVPSASLLLPYFEADLGNPNGSQTTVRLSNASATAVLAHVVLWTDLGVPTLEFNEYLTGYDSVDLDLRLLFQGIAPQTASAGQDPGDQISPKGTYSQDINFASCTGNLPPLGLPPATSGALPDSTLWEPTTLAAIRAAHTGQASTLWSGQCGAAVHGDNIARGYITIDTVNNCTLRFPSDAGYFQSGGTGDATNQNVLFGSYTSINRSLNQVATENLVNIEADAVNPQSSTSGQPTFYSRNVGGTAIDNREALGTTWAARNISGGIFPGGTKFVVWRDPGVTVAPFTCGNLPAPFPLTQNRVVAFDEQEHPTFLASSTNAFPYATQIVDSSTLSPYPFGWVALTLSDSSNTPLQSFVSVRHLSAGKFGDGTPAFLIRTQAQAVCAAVPTKCVGVPPSQVSLPYP